MWGNKLGWGISAVLVIVTVGTLVMFEMANSLTPPTAFVKDPTAFAAIELPVPPTSVVKMQDAGDAGDLYRQAIDDCNAHEQAYDDFTTHPRDLTDVQNLKGVDLLVKATHMGSMTLLSRTPEKYVTYESEKPDLDALRLVGTAATNAGLLAEQGNPAEATKYYEAAFALGAKLFNERLLYRELEVGVDLMSKASRQLETMAKTANDEAREKDVGDFRKAFVDYNNNQILPVEHFISSIDAAVIEQRVGDVFAMARNSKDKMWRTEAVFKVGRYKWNASRSADQRGAKRILKQMGDEPDPVVRIAVKAASELTIEDYHRLR